MGRNGSRNEDGSVNSAGIKYGDLIRQQRVKKKMNQEELGALVNVRKNAVGAWESGRSRPDLNSVPVICEALEISIEEFFGLKDQPVRREEREEKTVKHQGDAFSRRYQALDPYHQQVILREMDAMLAMQEAVKRPERKTVRLFRNELSVCAGPSFGIGETMGEEVLVYETEKTRKADEIIRISGDSMEPEFHDGDQVLVQHGVSLRPGEIGIFVNGDAGYIKIYQRDGLHSLNPKYRTMHFSEGDEVRCIGKVIGIIEEDEFA